MDLRKELEFIKSLARRAGQYQIDRLESRLHIESKSSPSDLVTDVDRASEETICTAIEGMFPDHDILSEEGTREERGSRYQWIIDPLDGTVNYAHGLHAFCVSIALLEDGLPVLAVIHHPTEDETFWAVKGSGAFINERRLRVSSEGDLGRSMLATGFPYDIRSAKESNVDHFCNFITACRAVRRIGSAALDLAWVAAGRFDGYWELKLKAWDMAAGILMVEEAGGRVTNFEGRPVDIHRPYIVASNGLIHDDMIKVINSGLRAELRSLA